MRILLVILAYATGVSVKIFTNFKFNSNIYNKQNYAIPISNLLVPDAAKAFPVPDLANTLPLSDVLKNLPVSAATALTQGLALESLLGNVV